MPPPPVSQTLKQGRYRLKQVLGEGGMATVYRAWDEDLSTWRAIKVLSPGMSMHAAMRERFEAEARTMARIRHPNVVEVYDVGQADGRAFFVMELMDGGSLEDFVRPGGRTLTPGQAVWAIDQVLAGLAEAHARGVVHRDIKPDNILLNVDGVPKLADFGIARVEDDSRKLTRTGSVLGTWAYMAPEQRTNAKAVDLRSDIYAITATLVALLTGREPFDLYTPDIQDEICQAVPAPLRAVIERGSRYKPDERYPDARAMRGALAASLPMVPIGPLPGALPPEPELTEEVSVVERPLLERAPRGDFEVDEAPTGLTIAQEPAPRPGLRFIGLALAAVLLVFGGIAWMARGGGEVELAAGARPPRAPRPTPVIVHEGPGEDPSPGAEDSASAEPDLVPSGAAPPEAGSPGPSRGGRPPSGVGSPWGQPVDQAAPVEPPPTTPDAVALPEDARRIVVRSWPPADVLVNRVRVGRTPLETDVETRKARVTLVTDDGQEKTVNASLSRGQAWEWCWNFDQGADCERSTP